MRDFALIQVAPGRLLVGWGPFRRLPRLEPGLPCFYITDYFLDCGNPWHVPAEWEVISAGELVSRLGRPDSLTVDWARIDDASLQSLFRSAHSAVSGGELRKVVPVVFEEGKIRDGDPARALIGRIPSFPASLTAYGYRMGDEGLIGATPEALFSLAAGRLETAAVAGTRSMARRSELLSDPKERREHELVVRDIVAQLEPLGSVTSGETHLLELPGLAHLVTPIVAEVGPGAAFERIVAQLHPTAALGAWPRGDAGARWLREADRGVARGPFGAPFGAVLEDGSALCLVAIRNVIWRRETVRIGSGAGILSESTLESERKELKRKRDQVRALFGLAPVAAG
ncbi:MAG TPA: chorismate-binding protein, partial [Thermoanaerobaculia bacterium]|nr:chorismate-binding protein [Thermoanaerobaculia bacterium]